MPDALELLKTRRSMKPREMSGPGPSPAELDTILTIGARVPDHGKLAPWRFIVFEGDARARAGDVIAKVFARKNPGAPAADIDVEKRRLTDAPLVIGLVVTMIVLVLVNTLYPALIVGGALVLYYIYVYFRVRWVIQLDPQVFRSYTMALSLMIFIIIMKTCILIPFAFGP